MLYKNETSHADMIDIMSHLQEQYVPSHTSTEKVHNELKDETFTAYLDTFHHVLLGGDQLTVERAMGSKKERCNEVRGTERLEGLIPVIEDWHAKVTLLKVCYIHFIRDTSDHMMFT